MKDYHHKIQYYETDKMGVTHHSNYVRIMEEARIDFLEQTGWSYAKFEEIGLVSPVISIECNFKLPTTYPDEISVKVAVKKVSMCKLVLGYTFTANGNVVFTATSSHCFIDKDGKPIIVAERFPQLYEDLKKLCEL